MAREPNEEAPPRRVVVHVIGEALDDLSVRDFEERIALLRAEIDRLETGRRHKEVARNAAGSFFKAGAKTGQN